MMGHQPPGFGRDQVEGGLSTSILLVMGLLLLLLSLKHVVYAFKL